MQALDALRPPDAGERKTLADIIFAKIDGGAAIIQNVHQGS